GDTTKDGMEHKMDKMHRTQDSVQPPTPVPPDGEPSTFRPLTFGGWLRTRTGLVVLALLISVAFYLVTEHTLHLLAVLPFAIFLVCPLMMMLMMRGMGGMVGGNGGKQ